MSQTWTCFHCGEMFANPNLAGAHFGETPDRKPACVLIQERGMLYELRAAQDESAKARLDARLAEEREESARGELAEYHRVAKVTSVNELRCRLDEMEGYVVTAKALIDAFFHAAPSLYEKVIGPRNVSAEDVDAARRAIDQGREVESMMARYIGPGGTV